MKIIVVGHRTARMDLHGDLVAEALTEVVGGNVEGHGEPEPHTLVHGGNPLGGIDDIAANIAQGWGWTIISYAGERNEVVGGTGVGNYRAMVKAGADLMVLFPGLNDSDAREAELWAIRAGMRYVGYPLTSKREAAAAAGRWAS